MLPLPSRLPVCPPRSRPYATGDLSTNCAWLALPTFGEAWHNNHHAFPYSARHGLEAWQVGYFEL